MNRVSKSAAYITATLAVILLLAAQPHSRAAAQVATDLYGQASLTPGGVPAVEEPGAGSKGPQGSAQFYQVGDAAGSTRVEVTVEGLQPGAQATVAITEGGCDGPALFQLKAMTADAGGVARSSNVLEGGQVAFGQWYVTLNLCDPLNPLQTCTVRWLSTLCGKVNPVIPLAGGSVPPQSGTTQGTPGMPRTGNVDGPLPLSGVIIASLSLLVLFAGAWLRDGRSRLP